MAIERASVGAPDQVLNINNVSKDQLARTVNEQTQQILSLRAQVKAMAQVLIAITNEPEAFHYADGRVTVENTAVEKTKKGTQLKIEYEEYDVVLRTVGPEDTPKLITPRIALH